MEVIIAGVVIVIALAIIVYLNIKENGIRKTIVNYIVLAEEKFEKGMNEDKFDFVFKALDSLIKNPILKIFFNKSAIQKLIQTIFDEVKEALDYREEVK